MFLLWMFLHWIYKCRLHLTLTPLKLIRKLQKMQSLEIPNDISTTPRQTNVTVLCDAPQAEDTNGSITSDGMPDVHSTKDSAWGAHEDIMGFSQVHFHLFETVTMWIQHNDVGKHPFY
jgi:hypothetical protein